MTSIIIALLHAIQPLAVAALITMLLLQKNRPDNKTTRAGLFFIAGISLAYLTSLFISIEHGLLTGLHFYVSLAVSFCVLLLGLHYIYTYFKLQGVSFHGDITSGVKRLERIQRSILPMWSFFLAGITVGVIEPLRLGAVQQQRIQELMLGADLTALSVIFMQISLSVLPLLIILALYWGGARKRHDEVQAILAKLLLFGCLLIFLSWLFVFLSADFVLL